MGVYEQLEQLNKVVTPPATPVGLSKASIPAATTGHSPNDHADPNRPFAQSLPVQTPIPPKATRNSTSKLTLAREIPRNGSSDIARETPRDLPNREAIQTFSFQLRDELKVKVQAEVPHHWQKELDDLARELDVKKLELYRFILGEFLGKVRRS